MLEEQIKSKNLSSENYLQFQQLFTYMHQEDYQIQLLNAMSAYGPRSSK